MAVRLLIPGRPDASVAALARGGPVASHRAPRTDLLQGIEVVGAFSLSPAARASAAVAPQAIDARDDDILEFELDGVTCWTSVARYAHEQSLYRPESVSADGVLVDGVSRPSAAERGVRDWAAGALRILRLGRDAIAADLDDPSLQEEFVREAGLDTGTRIASWLLTKFLAWLIERRLRPAEGLYAWQAAVEPREVGAEDPRPASLDGVDPRTPILLFIHGTASNTRGSFGAFLTADGAQDWRAVTTLFGRHIYAFEHRTLSRSPIENALALARALPQGARLSLVTHSRGGLVGDLLCLGGLSAAQIDGFVRQGDGLAEADAFDRARLRELADVLAARQFRVERYLRCASPSRGTLLASENLDEFLSILTNLVGLVPALASSPVYDVVTRVTLEAVRRRWEPDVLPGIEAMTPASPLVRLLNGPDAVAAGRLGIVAGDIEGGHLFRRIGAFITDRFIYDHRDNDLVVNTDAMFHGARRDTAWYVYDQGADVSHFTYFSNARTRGAAVSWLTATDASIPQGFRERETADVPPVPMARAREAPLPGRPVAVVVPGFMGSELYAGGRRVWPSVDELASGGLRMLEDVGDPDVTAPALVGDVYRQLCERLAAAAHDVRPFPYDWRRSLVETAARLDVLIRELLATKAPIRIVGHGMGGAIVRVWMDRHRATWSRVSAHHDARVLLTGAPLRGSYDAVQALVGTHPVLQQLALLDPARGPAGCIELVQRWTGLLELLPVLPDDRFASPETWQALRREVPATPPSEDVLRDATAVLRGMHVTPPHADRIVSLAGAAPRTVCDVVVRGDVTLLEMTSEGDGRVTYESSHIPGVVTWFADVPHGDVPGDPSTWPALLDLLERGTTRRLGTVPPSVARGGRSTYVTRPEPVLYPTPDALELAALGHRPRIVRRRAERGGFRVGVVYGDLRFARHPVMVGHYEGDTIVGAEAQIDKVLDGALRTRYDLGLYPGPYGSVAVVLREPTELQRSLRLMSGAIVLGLGRWGELTAAQVANLVRRGVLEYVLQYDEQRGADTTVKAGAEQLGLSVLLIGSTSTANISVDDSVGAILRGVAQANQELLSKLGHLGAMIGEVEIIELYADTAIQAARAAARLAATISEELGTHIEAAPLLQRGRHGRIRLTAASNMDAWRRWEVTAHTRPAPSATELPSVIREQFRRAIATGQPAEPALVEALADMAFGRDEQQPVTQVRFVSLSERARAEVMLQHRQPELIERLVESSVGQTTYRPQDARALFELMVPNDLKDGMGQLSRLVLVVDEETARYPWELMSDGGPPLCTRIGMVRQLQTGRYRPQIRATTTRSALVIGDPLVSPPFRQLPGARVEASVVADLLSAAPQPFTITRRVDRPTALDVLGGLFEQPYRIVHIAGHGHYEPPSESTRGRSGVVLDGGLYLTAVEFGQMLQVPELVFLNCCFIGQTGPESGARGRNVPFNRLAASVARELIEMGVRAVVAAGWAVRDDAALHLARVFYTQMLQGATFGRALQEARASTFHQFPESNTWGAYQAYGDPDFRLDEGGEPPPPRDRVAHEELIDLLERMREQARTPDAASSRVFIPAPSTLVAMAGDAEAADPTDAAASRGAAAVGAVSGAAGANGGAGSAAREADAAGMAADAEGRAVPVAAGGETGGPQGAASRGGAAERIAELDRIVQETPSAWLARSDVLMALGHAYGEWSAYEPAIKHLKAALDTGELDNRTTLKAVEQLANFEARLAIRDAEADHAYADERAEARERVGLAIQRLWGLQAVAETAERYGLIGSAYKRLAYVCETRDDVRVALEQSGDSYRRAYVHNVAAHRDDPYPIVNWMGIQALLGQVPDDAHDALAVAEAAARERFETARDPFDAVFDAVAVADIALVTALIDGTLMNAGAERDAAIQRLVALYQEAFRRTYATPRQITSASGQLEFLAAMYRRLATPETAEAYEQASLALEDVHRRVTGEAARRRGPVATAAREDDASARQDAALPDREDTPTRDGGEAARGAKARPAKRPKRTAKRRAPRRS